MIENREKVYLIPMRDASMVKTENAAERQLITKNGNKNRKTLHVTKIGVLFFFLVLFLKKVSQLLYAHLHRVVSLLFPFLMEPVSQFPTPEPCSRAPALSTHTACSRRMPPAGGATARRAFSPTRTRTVPSGLLVGVHTHKQRRG